MRITFRVPRDRGLLALARRAFMKVGAVPVGQRVPDDKAGRLWKRYAPSGLVDVAGHVPRREMDVYGSLFSALVEINLLCLKGAPTVAGLAGAQRMPRVYVSDVIYCREPVGHEVWQSLPAIHSAGVADCEDLACARVAELTVAGQEARVRLTGTERTNGSRMYHVTVWRTGPLKESCVEDPSKRLGMQPADEQ